MTSASPVTFDDLRRSERVMLAVRVVAIVWGLLQVLTYTTMRYPSGTKTAGLIMIAIHAAAVAGSAIATTRVATLRGAKRLGWAGLTADTLAVSGFVWLFAFDQESALWAILLVIPLEGAIRFQLRGALGTWAATTALYVAREIWGSDRYGYRLQWDSITFRMGIALMVTLVAGLMARDLIRQRELLRIANDNLQSVDRTRSALVTTLAHDVRNPLTAIRGTFSILQAQEGLDPAIQELVRATDRSAERLERLALNLLDLARLDEGRLHLEVRDVALAPIVRAVLDFADPHGAVEAVVDPGLTARTDPERLEQILVNLVSNALRHGAAPITISAEQAGTTVRISVADCGDGVAPNARAGLFEPFHPAAARGSIGFGLTVVKSLVEASGGRVSYRDNEPSGAVFTVELPGGTPDSGSV